MIDGDTLEIRGTRIRFHGVDAPESAQLCQDAGGRAYRCGQQAALALSDKIGSANVTCQQKDVDRYQRIVAQCSANRIDLNGWLIEQGYALAYRQYSTEYVPQEDAARKAKRGLWAGSFTPPWDWRRGERGPSKAEPAPQVSSSRPQSTSSDCRIKGNISAKGEKIYHLPGSRAYDRTVVNEAAGERWFCSESDAITAGWRAPKG
ncbi:thermonuclease family protein [Microvirga calopogonii]|uniref:thermonuclease family protein n=1 Tax=Microvirga calopogonii TaxID=2078013 RepID=UPI00315C956E